MRRGHELAKSAGFADNRRELSSRSHQHTYIVLAETSGFDCLYDEDALKQSPIDQGDAEKRVVRVFACFGEILESWMGDCVFDYEGLHLLGDKADQSLVKPHANSAYALRAESERCRQHEV